MVLSIQVVYQRAGQVYVTYDASLDPWPPPPETLCGNLQTVVPTTAVLSQGLGVDDTDARPRIASATDGFMLINFFAVWQRTSTTGLPEVHLARDLIGDGTGWTTLGELTAEIGADGLYPDVIGDVLDTAFPPARRVTVYFQDDSDELVKMTRNPDAGDPGAWDVPFAVSSNPGQQVSADNGSGSMGGGDTSLWTGAAWLDPGSAEFQFDAAFHDDPACPCSATPTSMRPETCSATHCWTVRSRHCPSE